MTARRTHLDYKADGYRHLVSIADTHPLDTIHYNWTGVVDSFNGGAEYEITAWIKTENAAEPYQGKRLADFMNTLTRARPRLRRLYPPFSEVLSQAAISSAFKPGS